MFLILLVSGEIISSLPAPSMPSAFRAKLIGRGPRNATMCKKPERLHFLETGGEALGQNNGIISYAPAWKAVPLRLIVLPSRQLGTGCSLIPRASPPVSKMYSLPGLRCNGLYSAAKQSGRFYRTPIYFFTKKFSGQQ